MKDTRRDFLKKTGAAVLPLGMVATASAQPNLLSQAGAHIRMKRAINDPGWKYIRVKDVSRAYPALEETQPIQPSQYGGNSQVQWKATGKFRTEQVDGRWWLVDPEGHPFLSCGVNSVNPRGSSTNKASVKELGGEQKWSKEAIEMLKANGFNTAGKWSYQSDASSWLKPHDNIPYVYFQFGTDVEWSKKSKADPTKKVKVKRRVYGLMEGFVASVGVRKKVNSSLRILPLFHPDFASFCDKRCQELVKVKDDPWLLGYFTDNELRPPALAEYLQLDTEDRVYGPAVREARRWREQQGKTGPVSQEENVTWTAHAFDWYLKTVSTAIRRYDQEHLILGSRLFAWERNHPEIFEAVGRYVDVVSLNPYGFTALPVGRVREWSKWAGGKPVMIGEFYVKGMDVGLGNKAGGAGLVVPDQKDRGAYYQNYVLHLLESGVCVGWHWHRYADHRKPGERKKSGVDLSSWGINNGLVNAELRTHEPLVVKAKELNARVYEVVSRMKSLV